MQLNIRLDEKALYAELGESQIMLKATRNLLNQCVAIMTPEQLQQAGIAVSDESTAPATMHQPEMPAPNGRREMVGVEEG